MQGEPLNFDCPDSSWGVSAIRIRQLIELGLRVERTPPHPHHVDAFGLKEMGVSKEKTTRKKIALCSLIAVWPGGSETWPPTDYPPFWLP
jgi:hypothetical protein